MSKDELRPAVDEFAPIPDDSVLLTEREAVMANVKLGGWMSAALDDPAVCDAMKADIERWFSAGFLYLDEVRGMIEADRAEVARLTEQRVVEGIVAWLKSKHNGRLQSSVYLADCIADGEWKQ